MSSSNDTAPPVFDRATEASVQAMATALHAIQPLTQSYWITFGTQYRRRPPDTPDSFGEPHPLHPLLVDGTGFVRVDMDSEEDARRAAMRHFDHHWSFLYDHTPGRELYPLGELGVIDADGALNWHQVVAA